MLREFREEAGLSQKDLAYKSNIGQPYLSRVEKASRPPPSGKVSQRIASVLEEAFKRQGRAISVSQQLQDLARMARVERDQYGPSSLAMDTVTEERASQRGADEVWVVAARPLELEDAEYRQLVIDGLREKEPRPYIYWTSMPDHFDALYGMLVREINQGSTAKSVGEAERILGKSIKCIQTPPSATWFSFVLYRPKDPYGEGDAYLAMELRGRPAGRVIPVGETTWISRALDDLKVAHRYLVQMGHLEYRDSSGGLWRRHFPS